MSADARVPTSDEGSIDALKRVRAAEIDWDQKVTAAKQEAGEAIAALRTAADAAVRAAQAAADQERAAKVQVARSEADREAITIVADGATAADAAAKGEGRQPADKADEILRAVLAGFLPD
jgi:vacuolar-type H+-ATPase subunit H